ncbi:MAG: hypothetical protein ACOC58_00345 [Chloroflexota bacterium]
MVQQGLATPRTLSMEEYRSDWEPQGWQILVIGPTATWRREWGEWEAIRDIVQNALDETEDYSWGYDDEGLYIRDIGKGIAVADFLLGPPKPKPDYARGKFGEGMKIAALTLLRGGYKVRIDTVGREVWVVFLRVKVDGSADQLAALWRTDGRRHGTVFHIVGYFGDAFADRFAVNIPKRDILHQGPSPIHEPIRRYNQLIATPAGRIYARDIFMREINSPFSYNLWGFAMAPDRHGPASEGAMWDDVARLWATVTDVNLLERFLGMIKESPDEDSDEARQVNMNKWNMGKEPATGKYYSEFINANGDAWRTAWRRKMGELAVLRTDSRWNNTVAHLGYESASVSWQTADVLSLVIKTDTALVRESQQRLSDAQIMPDESLGPRQLVHLKLARKIAEKFRPRIEGLYAAIIPPASDRMRTAGLYNKDHREIYISPDQLERASWTVNTVIHEIAHHTSGAEDLAEAHSEEMTRVAARVVENTAAGLYDEELKEAVW